MHLILWWTVVVISAGLVGMGVIVLLRDIGKGHASKRASAVARTQTPAATAQPLPHWPGLTPPGGGDARPKTAYDIPPADDDGPMTGPSLARVPACEAQWPRMRPEVEAAVGAANAQVASVGVAIGPPGAPSWSLRNHGYGDYRRVLIDGDSIAWLRLELASDGAVWAKLRAHDPEIAIINGTSTAPPQRASDQLPHILLEALATTTQYANWRLTNVPASNQARTGPDAAANTPSTVAAPLPATAVPQSTAALADAAIALVNSAFQEAGARLMPLRANQWPSAAGREARVFAIDANGALAGTMLVDPQPDRIDIAVTAGRNATANAAKRQSLPVADLSVHALAEAVATSAWPAIAAALPRTR